MATKERLRNIPRHIRNRLISGMFILVPLGITVLVLAVIFNAMASFVSPVVHKLLPTLDATSAKVVSIVVFAALVYLTGVISTYLFGRKLVTLAEAIILRIPIVKTIYSASKQVIDTLSLSNKSAFKSVVLVDFPRKGTKCVAFVTGSVTMESGEEAVMLFMPTVPNPTTGFLLIAPRAEVRETGMSIEDAVKLLLSGGILAKEKLGL